MRIRSNPKCNIKLSQLRDCKKGFISLDDVRPIVGAKDFNFAINLNALVYTVKSQEVCIPVFGTGDGKLDFDVDLSVFVFDKSIDVKNLPSGDVYDWYQFKIDVLDNTLLVDDSDFEDESFEDYFENWLIFSGEEKKNLIKEIKDFLLRDCDSMDVSEIIFERKETKNSIKKLEKLISAGENDEEYSYYQQEFDDYDLEEKRSLCQLFGLKLDFINTYLLSSDN
jgi:hypothetical protein